MSEEAALGLLAGRLRRLAADLAILAPALREASGATVGGASHRRLGMLARAVVPLATVADQVGSALSNHAYALASTRRESALIVREAAALGLAETASGFTPMPGSLHLADPDAEARLGEAVAALDDRLTAVRRRALAEGSAVARVLERHTAVVADVADRLR